MRDHWHTLTRTALAPELCRHAPEPTIDIHPADAEAQGLKPGQLARLVTPLGEAVAPVRLTDAQRQGDLYLPMHWTAMFAPHGRCNTLVAPDVDPVSGQPELKHAPARISAYRETWRGFHIGREMAGAALPGEVIWRRIPQAGCQLVEFADVATRPSARAVAAAFGAPVRGAEVLSMDDAASGALRRAAFEQGRLADVLFITVGAGRLPPRDWLIERFGDATLDPAARPYLLAGFAPGFEDLGAVVCACRNVRERTLQGAIAKAVHDVDSLGSATGAGLTCGSCRPALARLIAQQATEERHAA